MLLDVEDPLFAKFGRAFLDEVKFLFCLYIVHSPLSYSVVSEFPVDCHNIFRLEFLMCCLLRTLRLCKIFVERSIYCG